jgi:hypothetical protein
LVSIRADEFGMPHYCGRMMNKSGSFGGYQRQLGHQPIATTFRHQQARVAGIAFDFLAQSVDMGF